MNPNHLLRLARRTAPLLGPGWSATSAHPWGKKGAVLAHCDGRRIILQPADRRPSHVRATVEYPKTSLYLYESDKPSTEFRHDRPAPALAEAINAKLLPTYNAVYPKAVAAAEASRATYDRLHAYARRIAAHVPGAELTRTEPSPWVQYRAGKGSIESVKAQILSGEQHLIEFRYVDDETLDVLMHAYGEIVRRKKSRGASEA